MRGSPQRRRAAGSRGTPLELLLPETILALEAYAEGVNAWVASHELPVEYGSLELTQFEPWTVLDSVAVGKLIALDLSLDLGDIQRTGALLAYRQAGVEHGLDGDALFFEDMFRAAPFDPAATVSDALAAEPLRQRRGRHRRRGDPIVVARRERARVHGRVSPGLGRLTRRFIERARHVPLLARALEERDAGGSPHPLSRIKAVEGRRTLDAVVGASLRRHQRDLVLYRPLPPVRRQWIILSSEVLETEFVSPGTLTEVPGYPRAARTAAAVAETA